MSGHAKLACTLDTSAVVDEPEPDHIRLDFHKWTKFASSIEKFQHRTTGSRGRESQEIRAALLRGRTWLLRAYIIGRGESCLRPTPARAQITKFAPRLEGLK